MWFKSVYFCISQIAPTMWVASSNQFNCIESGAYTPYNGVLEPFHTHRPACVLHISPVQVVIIKAADQQFLTFALHVEQPWAKISDWRPLYYNTGQQQREWTEKRKHYSWKLHWMKDTTEWLCRAWLHLYEHFRTENVSTIHEIRQKQARGWISRSKNP